MTDDRVLELAKRALAEVPADKSGALVGVATMESQTFLLAQRVGEHWQIAGAVTHTRGGTWDVGVTVHATW